MALVISSFLPALAPAIIALQPPIYFHWGKGQNAHTTEYELTRTIAHTALVARNGNSVHFGGAQSFGIFPSCGGPRFFDGGVILKSTGKNATLCRDPRGPLITRAS